MDSPPLAKSTEARKVALSPLLRPSRPAAFTTIWASLAGGISLLVLAAILQGISFGYENLTWLSLFAPFVFGAAFTFLMFRIMQISLRRQQLDLQQSFNRRTRDLRTTEDRFREYADTSREWFWETDDEDRFTFVSSYLFRVSGAQPEDIIGKSRQDLRLESGGAEEDEQWAYYEQCVAAREPFVNFRYRARISGGRESIYSTSGRPYYGNRGEFLGYRGSAFDVTDEQQERQREIYALELIYSAMALLDHGFILFDADDRMVMCNDRFRQVYSEILDKLTPGVSFEEIMRASVDRQMQFGSEEEKQAWIRQRLEQHRNPSGPVDQKLSSGEWIRIIEQKLPDGGTVGLRIDLTDAKRLEEEFENAQRIAHVGSWRWNVVDDSLRSCTQEYAAIHGVGMGSISKHLDRQMERVVHPDDRERVIREFARFDLTGENYEIEYRILRPDGEVRHVIERGEASLFENGVTVEQRGTLQDVTERVQARSEQLKSEEMLQVAIENAPGGFILINAEGKIERFNRQFCELYPDQQAFIKKGVPYENFLRRGAEQGVYLDPGGDPQAWVARRMQKHRVDKPEFYDHLADGRLIRIAGRKLPDGSRVGMHVDVTELQNALQAAERANEAKSDFLASMSHELRTPMHGILSFAELALKRIDTLSPEKMKQYLSNIQISGTRLLYLLNDLLDLSILEAGKMNLDLSRVNLSDLITACISEQEIQLEARRLHCQLQSVSADAGCICDRYRIFQVLSNVMANAIKFSPQDGEVRISLERRDDSFRIGVSDQGIGIPEQELDQIFTKFYQSSNRRQQGGGTGLGLAICREIIELHHGRIWAENNPESGSSIFFEIPAEQPGRGALANIIS